MNLTMSIYFNTDIIVIESIIFTVINTVILVNNLISVNYLCFQPLVIALKCLTYLYSIYTYRADGGSIGSYKLLILPLSLWCSSVVSSFTKLNVLPYMFILALCRSFSLSHRKLPRKWFCDKL